MGNNLCQCEVICERNKEKDFSSSRDLSRIKSVKSMKNDNYKIDLSHNLPSNKTFYNI